MESGVKTKRLKIGGMTCINCQNKIERRLQNAAGVKNVKVSYSAGTADVAYDTDIISLKDITAIIEKLDYQVLTGNKKQESNVSRVVGVLVIVVSLYVLLEQFGVLNLLVPSQLADTKMGYGMLFVIGLITSIHCIAMCGGINLSQCIPHKDTHVGVKQSRMDTFAPAVLYNLGRVISYTVIGFILGFVGLLFGGGGSDAGLPVMAQGILKLIAGVFMVIMGINMLGLFPWLRKLQPRMPKIFGRKISAEKAKNKSPLIVGLLNGLMPCGPLQSMQIVALASGNPLAGGLSMLLFSLGTVPLMLGLGSIVSALGKKFTAKVMSVGAVLVVVLGLAMLSQGGSLSGFLPPDLLLPVILTLCAVGVVSSIPFKKTIYKTVSTVAVLGVAVIVLSTWSSLAGGSNPAGDRSGVSIVDGKQIVTSTLTAGSYPNITVQVGTPVKWTINAPKGSINGCNNRMNIQEFDVSNYSFKQGDNVIEFTPDKTGKFSYSCWMGMIRGSIIVTEVGAAPAENTDDGSADDDTGNEIAGYSDPVPARYTIPTDNVAIANETNDKYGYTIQEVTIELTDKGFRPAIVIVKAGLEVQWNIKNSASGAENGISLLVPNYATQLMLRKGENPLSFNPEVDFDFSTGDNTFYGYVKVVDDINKADIAAIKAEIGKFETKIWPPETFESAGGSAGGSGGTSCH